MSGDVGEHVLVVGGSILRAMGGRHGQHHGHRSETHTHIHTFYIHVLVTPGSWGVASLGSFQRDPSVTPAQPFQNCGKNEMFTAT